MSKNPGWWKLTITPTTEDDVEPSEIDLEHIADMITQGCTEGEIVKDDTNDEQGGS